MSSTRERQAKLEHQPDAASAASLSADVVMNETYLHV
jgi:hypothetical protein